MSHSENGTFVQNKAYIVVNICIRTILVILI